MKQPIRYFSIGLITASLILFIILSFVDKPIHDLDEIPTEELIANIKGKGYHILSSSEYITLSLNDESESNDDVNQQEENKTKEENQDEDNETNKEENNKDIEKENQVEEKPEKEKDEKENVEKEKEKVFKYTLHVEPNMLGPTISKLLADNQIITDAEAFNRYLETEGYAPYIQLGKHKLTSDMTTYEIAEKIAKKK